MLPNGNVINVKCPKTVIRSIVIPLKLKQASAKQGSPGREARNLVDVDYEITVHILRCLVNTIHDQVSLGHWIIPEDCVIQ